AAEASATIGGVAGRLTGDGRVVVGGCPTGAPAGRGSVSATSTGRVVAASVIGEVVGGKCIAVSAGRVVGAASTGRVAAEWAIATALWTALASGPTAGMPITGGEAG